MSLFFDADWFETKLAERGLDRAALAAAAGLDQAGLDALFANERAPGAAELAAFAALLNADVLEVTLRSGVAERGARTGGDTGARIENFEARLDAIDTWLAEMENKRRA